MRNKVKIVIAVCSAVVVVVIVAAIIWIGNSQVSGSGNIKDNNSDHRYCTTDSRNADVCAQVYAPVCGYPETQTYSNSCFACMDASVEYYVNGECA